MGPTLILDKSAFESLTRREHLMVFAYFEQNLTPILALEILGDLTKETTSRTSPEKFVAALSAKFGGSGPVTNVDYRTLCLHSLQGAIVPMDGSIIPEAARSVVAEDGSAGMVIELGHFNQALLRWSRGEFLAVERDIAEYWRTTTREFSLGAFMEAITTNHIIIPRAKQPAEIPGIVDQLLGTTALQGIWLNWLLSELRLPDRNERAIRLRYKGFTSRFLVYFAPYAAFCLRVMLSLAVAVHHRLTKWEPTKLLDIQYLFYLPFCMVFSSHDRVHRLLTPGLLRRDQFFVQGTVLKADLRRLVETREKFSQDQMRKLGYALGAYPVPAKGSVIHDLWKTYARPWRPGMGNAAVELTTTEKREANAMAEQLFRETEGDSYFDSGG